MAKKVKIELNSAGVRELLHECGRTVCKEKADSIAARCGAGYASDTKNAGTRTIAGVITDSVEAMKDNNNNNTLLKALK